MTSKAASLGGSPARAAGDAGRAAREDGILGMALGAALGDALGAPHEFRYQVPLARYSGRLEHATPAAARYRAPRRCALGQVTDDTEMALALAGALAARGHFERGATLAAYLDWANSGCPFMGRNTRALLAGVSQPRYYEARRAKLAARPEAEQSQSNGPLMRAWPLAALPDQEWEAAAAEDCALTNWHPVSLGAERVYVGALRDALAGLAPGDILERAAERAPAGPVADVIDGVTDRRPRDVTKNGGWCLHALHCALWPLRTGAAPAFGDGVDVVVRLGGDTDTNACIAGALLGALHGAEAMRREATTAANLAVLLAADTACGEVPRPARFEGRAVAIAATRLAVATAGAP